jgi:hypothetical protein
MDLSPPIPASAYACPARQRRRSPPKGPSFSRMFEPNSPGCGVPTFLPIACKCRHGDVTARMQPKTPSEKRQQPVAAHRPRESRKRSSITQMCSVGGADPVQPVSLFSVEEVAFGVFAALGEARAPRSFRRQCLSVDWQWK